MHRRAALPASPPGEFLLAYPFRPSPVRCGRHRCHGDRCGGLGPSRLREHPRADPVHVHHSAERGRERRRHHPEEGPGRRCCRRRHVQPARLHRQAGRQRHHRRRGPADTFQDLAPGVYRLKEVSSGTPLHEVVDDQDVIVTPGADTPLTIIDPFKPASVLLKAKDDKTGKLLAGSTVNIGSGDKTILTLTTSSDGTASGKLPINSRTGSDFWIKQVKAPEGYEIYKPSKAFRAKPGAPVTVTVTNAKSATTPPPTEKPTDKPTDKPSDRPTPDKPGQEEDTSSRLPRAHRPPTRPRRAPWPPPPRARSRTPAPRPSRG